MIGSGFSNIFKIPELKKRIFYTLALLVVYRIGVQIPTPGIDSQALLRLFEQQETEQLVLTGPIPANAS